MQRTRRFALIVLAAAAVAGLSITASRGRSPFAPFVGTWWGHTRTLAVHEDGSARETVYDGCCTLGFDLRLVLERPTRSGDGGRAVVHVVSVRAGDDPGAPRVGAVGVLDLSHDVIDESLTGTNYCGPHPPQPEPCGA